MRCPECFTVWQDKPCFHAHLLAHSLDAWTIRNLLERFTMVTRRSGRHAPDEGCTCRMYWCQTECELQKLRAA